jgi:glycosyltransferase A (GT-A) superfamily protein (DUF2064 family)
LTDRAAAVVVAGPPPPGLEPVLGREGAKRLRAVLLRRAVAWAEAVGDPYVVEPAGATTGERLASVCREVFDEHGGPILLADAGTPYLRRDTGERALEDLREDCDATFGPSTAAGFYLVGLRAAHTEVFDVPPEAWGGPEHLARTFEAAHRAGLSLGMLRAERGLQDEGDVRALLADPLAPADVVEVLRSVT